MAVLSDDLGPKLEAAIAKAGVPEDSVRRVAEAVVATLAEDPKLVAMVEMTRMSNVST